VFPEKQETQDRLKLIAFRLHKLQLLLQEGAPCPHLLCELKSVETALVSVQMDLVMCNLRSSFSGLQSNPKNYTKELTRILELFTVTSDF
jgi:DNA-binding FrmR family transcriptional regulator